MRASLLLFLAAVVSAAPVPGGASLAVGTRGVLMRTHDGTGTGSGSGTGVARQAPPVDDYVVKTPGNLEDFVASAIEDGGYFLLKTRAMHNGNLVEHCLAMQVNDDQTPASPAFVDIIPCNSPTAAEPKCSGDSPGRECWKLEATPQIESEDLKVQAFGDATVNGTRTFFIVNAVRNAGEDFMLLNAGVGDGSGNNLPKVPQVVNHVKAEDGSYSRPGVGGVAGTTISNEDNGGNDYYWVYSNKQERHFFHTCTETDDGRKACSSRAIPTALQAFPEFLGGHGCTASVNKAACTATAHCSANHVTCSECKHPTPSNCQQILPGESCAPALDTDYSNSNYGSQGAHGCGVGVDDQVTCEATAECQSQTVACSAEEIECSPASTTTNLLLGMFQPRTGITEYNGQKDWCLKVQQPHGSNEVGEGSSQVIQIGVCAEDSNEMLWTLESAEVPAATATEAPSTET